LALIALLLLLVVPGTAHAGMPSLKESCQTADALDGQTSNAIQIPYRRCDDGVPPVGGRTPNEEARRAVRVPQRYRGYAGLPRRASPDQGSGADSRGFIALDVNVALPDRRRHPRPLGGYPLIVLLHGSPGTKNQWRGTIDARGERWHYNDAWFAARGYAVLSYTSRGFVDERGRGSTGESQLGHRAYEVNDLQYLAGLLAEDPFFGIDPQRIVVSGASIGAGVAWLALTDPTWRSPRKRIDMQLAAVAPKYGWTDLAHALAPNGSYRRDEIAPADPNLALSRTPFGAPKRSLVSALSTAATYPSAVEDAFGCMTSSTPLGGNAACSGLPGVIDSFIRERSAYFQLRFLGRIAVNRQARVPVFSIGSFSNQLFPLEEHRRMAATLRSIVPNYPVKEYYGDLGELTQNKGKEWADLCDRDNHPCTVSDYKRGFNIEPKRFNRFGVATRLNRFLDHYARPPANPRQPSPNFDVTVSLQTCPQNASADWPDDEPGERFNADPFGELAPHELVLPLDGEQPTVADAEPNTHAAEADPVADPDGCASHAGPAGPGVATYDSEPLDGDATMIGQTRVSTTVSGAAPGQQLNVRLYDLYPNGTQVLVDRGVHTLAGDSETVELDLHGNAWRFAQGHRIRVEVAQDDDPYVRRSDQAAVIAVSAVRLAVPIRENAPGDPGDAGPDVNLRVVARSGGQFNLTARSPTGERTALAEYEFFVSDGGEYQPLPEGDDPFRRAYSGTSGVTYSFRARGIDRRGVPGPVAENAAQAR
jgi:dienelactone hydrolase